VPEREGAAIRSGTTVVFILPVQFAGYVRQVGAVLKPNEQPYSLVEYGAKPICIYRAAYESA
jgi:hypothetical protein